MKIFNFVKLIEMIYLIVLFYECYLYEFLILNDFYKIALHINYYRHHNILDSLHLHIR